VGTLEQSFGGEPLELKKIPSIKEKTLLAARGTSDRWGPLCIAKHAQSIATLLHGRTMIS